MSALAERVARTSLTWFGLAFVGLCAVVTIAAFQRHVIVTVLTPGDTVAAVFAREYRLRPYVSEVKIAGVRVGTVTSVDELAGGESEVGLKLDSGVTGKLGSAPSAAIRPATLLGGKYYVELTPGGEPGEFDGTISVERTRIAVETDAVLETLQPQARRGAQQFVRQTDATLGRDGQAALQDLLRDAPAALRPAGPAVDALNGERPDTLRQLVRGLDDTARVLEKQSGQLDSILVDLDRTAGVLDRERVPLAEAVGSFPETFRATRTGVIALRGSLDRLTATAPGLRPSARAMEPLLERLDPVLGKARPVLSDLADVLDDARPTLDDLAPAAATTTKVLDDLSGPVIDWVNGPILGALNSDWKGEGRYAGNSSPYKLYQDIAYAFTNVNGASKYTDKNGAALTIQVGQGPGAVSDFQGLPNTEDFLQNLIGPKRSPR